ncbi:MAG TPA: HAD family hydrolase [Clostridia bacterium]|nr:HAD family hydrolase [Clostridia bacterium]
MTTSNSLTQPSPDFLPRPQISHVVFDFDGTLSWLRHGWPEIMCQLFREHVPLRQGESEQALHDLLLGDILSLNGKPSIFQMRRCAELAAERNGQRPDPERLLLEYQRRLAAAILERTRKIQSGQCSRDNFVVHGARDLLKKLYRRGLVLVILSGTDEPQVKQEADLLNLTRYFGVHIYGGTPDHARSSKEAVINRLLREENIPGAQLLAFGDGPVEIQLTRKAGGLAVGVASDEDQNGSGKLDPHKLQQLNGAGAHLVIPDYRNPDALIECIFGK